MSKPLIGITVGEVINEKYPWAPVVLGQSHTYVDAIVNAGGIPLFIPLSNDQTVIRELYELCDGLIMCGGNDIDPSCYKVERSPLTVSTSKDRDTQELALLKWSEQDDKPVFAICRGMQLYNVFRGGTLYQDLKTERPGTSNHSASTEAKDTAHTAHLLKIDPDTKFAAIVKAQPLATNTHHHQGVRRLGNNLRINSWAEDGVIEGIEANDRSFAIGVQSHPESLEGGEPRWRAMFVSLVEAAKEFRK